MNITFLGFAIKIAQNSNSRYILRQNIFCRNWNMYILLKRIFTRREIDKLFEGVVIKIVDLLTSKYSIDLKNVPIMKGD